jgi:hypothetical protein
MHVHDRSQRIGGMAAAAADSYSDPLCKLSRQGEGAKVQKFELTGLTGSVFNL